MLDQVPTEVWIPYEGDVSKKITMLDNNESVVFEKKENGYQLQLPKYNGEETPIARVFCLQ